MTLNATASRAARDQGVQLALDMAGEWKTEVLLELRGWLVIQRAKGHTTMTFEQFRHDARAQPESHKAWGALPGIACRAGLIAPLFHPDGSVVVKAAESVKTHGHPVRVWALLDFFPSPGLGVPRPTLHDARRAEPVNQPDDIAHVGECRHSGRHA